MNAHRIKQKLILGFSLGSVLLILPLYAWKVSQKQDYTDFDVYFRAIERTKLQAWDQLYTLKDGASPFRYLPLWLPFFRPLGEFSRNQAQLVWYFLQVGWFCLGFYFLYQTLRVVQRKKPASSSATLTCLSFLFILRFCLDTFTIGQISSLMFFGFCLGLWAWVNKKSGLVSLSLLIPTLLKIGPGFIYGIFLTTRGREKRKALKASVLGFAFLQVFFLLWIGSWEKARFLWREWAQIVANDSVYYDASHYGSQSLKSVLLRAVNSGWISSASAQTAYLALVFTICIGIALFWLTRRPKTLYSKGLFYSVGLFAYIWLMPETFKYSLTPLAIPVAFLFAYPKKSWTTYFALGFGILTLSLAGKDVVGDFLFFSSQRSSLPALATLLLGFEVIRLAWKESRFSPVLKEFLAHDDFPVKKLGPWPNLPEKKPSLEISLLIPLPFQRTTQLEPKIVKAVISEFCKSLESLSSSSFEILVIPYGDRFSVLHPLWEKIQLLQSQISAVRVLPFEGLEGRGAALRTGFLACSGKKILISQIEQPCDFEFFNQALAKLTQGFELIRANRRLNESVFKLPVKILPLVYGRHRLGLWFNRLIRLLLPIRTTDTHSGTFVLSRELALHIFSAQTSESFLFDLEVSLVCSQRNCRELDLPVKLNLDEGEKSWLRVLSEALSIARGLPSLYFRYRQGCYLPLSPPTGITADDWGISPGVNQGILKLARLGMVNRVSIMANCSYIDHGLKELCSIQGIQLGLHFNLTYGKPVQPSPDLSLALLDQRPQYQGRFIPSPKDFLICWLKAKENKKTYSEFIQAELKSQLVQLKNRGIQVSYLDGHHHIHLVPGLIDVLAEPLEKAGIQNVRLPLDQSLWLSAKAPLLIFSLIAKKKFKKYGFKSLPCIYPSMECFEDPGKLRARLSKNPGTEVIVHPAEISDVEKLEIPDSYSKERVIEFQTLQMLGFPLC